jgi:hypothetical protein
MLAGHNAGASVRMKSSRLSTRCIFARPGTFCCNSCTRREGCLLAVSPVLDDPFRRHPTGQDAGVLTFAWGAVAFAARMLLVTFFNVARTRLRFAAWAGALACE